MVYDPTVVRYAELLDVFWRNIDPTVKDRQFCDWGSQYRTGIFTEEGAQQPSLVRIPTNPTTHPGQSDQ